LTVTEEWDPETGRFMLVLEQTCKPTPGQPTKEPFHIPVKLAFLDESGQRLHPEGPEARCDEGEWTLELCESRSTYAFSGFAEKPVVSLLREFSAPVRVHRKRTLADQALAFALDDDPYCRWEAGQQLMSQLIWDRYDGQPRDDDMMLVADALTKLLRDERADPAFKALCLRWPASTVLEGQRQGVHPLRLAEAKADAQTRLARQIAEPLSAIALQAKARERAASEAEARGWRALKNQAALFASLGGDAAALEQIRNQFIAASNMTDELAAFEFLVHHGSDEDREQAVSRFLARWQDEELVVDKWLMTQAQRPSGQALDDAARLWNHDVFRPTNPNKVRALAGALAANPWGFHRQDGAGYRWMADTVLAVDRTNPQVAARLVSVFNKWSGYDNATGRMMRESLQAIADAEGLSRDVAEIAEKALQQSSEG
jgi:aminopeptidase N